MGDTDDPMMKLQKSLEQHDEALKALKDVPNLISELAKKVGVSPVDDQQKNKPSWSLGISEDEDDPHTVANNILENSPGIQVMLGFTCEMKDKDPKVNEFLNR